MKKTLMRLAALMLVLMVAPVAALAETTAPERNANDMPYVLNAFDGTTLDLSQYKGKAVWLNYFTGWCQYCMVEMPHIKQAFETYSTDELAIVLIHVWNGEDADDSAEVVKQFGLEAMTMVEDTDMTLSTIVGLTGYPTSIFIDKEGYLAKVINALDYDGMAEIIDGMGVAKAATDAAAVGTP